MAKVATRQSNIELLRCVLMLMVVVSHFVDHNILNKADPVAMGDDNFYVSHLMNSLCICAVNCFVVISGYFTIKLSLRRITLFLLPIVFYQLLFSLVFYPSNHTITFSPFRYWFVAPYVVLILLSPFLNCGLEKISEKGLRNIIVVMLLLFVLPIVSITGQNGRNVFMFILMYLSGYYIRHYYARKVHWGGYLLLYVLSATLVFIEAIAYVKMGQNQGYATMSYYYDNILIYFEAISLFLIFTYFNYHSRVINWVASSSFFVYIISENENMYKGQNSLYSILGVESWNHLALYPLLILGAAVVVFICSILIDKLRIAVFGKLETQLGNWLDKLTLSFD